MPFVEIQPGESSEAVRVASTKNGALIVSLTASIARRIAWKAKQARCRVLVDLEAVPVRLQLVVDGAGPFSFRRTKGDGGICRIGPIKGLRGRVEKTDVTWDEDKNGEGHPLLEIELPFALERERAAPKQVAAPQAPRALPPPDPVPLGHVPSASVTKPRINPATGRVETARDRLIREQNEGKYSYQGKKVPV